jgi:hypothetical protein
MLGVPVKWVDVDGSGTVNAGDHLRIAFDRSVAFGANTPALDLAVANGLLGASTWQNGPGNNLTIVLAGAFVLTPGLQGAFTTVNLMAANTILNPVDGATPAVPAGAAQSLMANIGQSAQNVGNFTSFGARLENLNTQVAPDIALGVFGPNRLFANNTGVGTFTTIANWMGEPPGGNRTHDVALLDEDGDGRADFLVEANGNPPQANFVYQIPVAANPVPNHDFAPPPTNPWRKLGNDDSRAVDTADFDGDGNLDVVFANVGAQNVIYFGDGFGLFDGDDTIPGVANRQFFGGVNDTRDLDVGQIDGGATRLDIVTVDSNLLGGTFTPYTVSLAGIPLAGTQVSGLGDTQSVVLCDLDNDADLDAIVGLGLGGGLRLLSNNGAGVFTLVGGALGADNVFGVNCLDVNGDGFDDIVSGNANNQPDRVWLNAGAFAFQDSGLLLGGGSTMDIAVSVSLDGQGVDGVGGEDWLEVNAGAANVLRLTGAP